MSARFSFSFFCCYLLLVIVVSLSSKSSDDDVLCIMYEREALVQFKHGVIDEEGRLASWDDGEESDCCKWAGIRCDNITGHVHRIHLREQMLRGNLSSSLLHLKQLKHLDLSGNDFERIQVPKFIGSLRNLRYLNLSGSYFGGSIPPQLGNLSELQVLCLGNFHMPFEQTSVLNMQWLSSLRMLHHLDMSDVDLSNAIDWLQVINTLPSLVELHLSSTNLPNIHPHVASVNLTSLSLLNLSDNNFNSSFPQWIFSITSLVSLELSQCSFHGLIHGSIYSFRNLTSLESLNVNGNNIMNSSLVLRDLSSVGSNLISLNIGNCDISSPVFDSLQNLTSPLSLDLSGNQLTQRIPKSLGYLCNLKDLDLSGNFFGNISLTSLVESVFKCKSPHLESLRLIDSRLSSTIPESIGRLSFLRSLDLGWSQISGPIPSSIGRLSSLEVLSLSNNKLNGGLPESIGELSSLKELDLSNNQLNGNLPESIGRLSSLETLDLSNNQLNGVVTEAHFSELVSLIRLDGRGNNLTLRPHLSNWIPIFQLERLYLSSWVLGPQFPMWLQSQKDLNVLDISNTEISSPMPPESFWRSFPKFRVLDMSQNRIQGTLNLLSSISNFSIPDFLDLSNNLLGGPIYDFLCSNGVQNTGILNFKNNKLSGDIPECWEKWPYLGLLDLENNKFSGGIPTTLGSLNSLYSLNMRGNMLSGRLPSSLMNLSNLKILILGENELVGSIPSWFGRKLTRLSLLNLRSNHLDGNIPEELCYLQHIQILDLAHNNMSGNIPKCFNNFSVITGNEILSRSMLYLGESGKGIMGSDSLVMKGREDTYSSILGLVTLLDLSCNNLVGHIPYELTSLKALQTLNLSKNQLTGRIPEKIGDMIALVTFDLSLNMLSGELPVSFSNLNFLSSFNVSYNSLTGRIPSYTQFQTFNESSFFGNKLCGPILNETCTIDVVPDKEDKKEGDGANMGLIVSIVLGFIFGFWIVLAPLIVIRSWRIAYFRFMSDCGYMVYDFTRKYCFDMFSK